MVREPECDVDKEQVSLVTTVLENFEVIFFVLGAIFSKACKLITVSVVIVISPLDLALDNVSDLLNGA